MTKKNFVFTVLWVLAGLLFALGMCMCLVPEWNAFKPGVAVTALGPLSLMALGLIKWIHAGRPVKKIDWVKTGKIAYVTVSCLVLGGGMALIMAAENMLLPGMLVGVAGILMLVCAVPVCRGFKKEG